MKSQSAHPRPGKFSLKYFFYPTYALSSLRKHIRKELKTPQNEI